MHKGIQGWLFQVSGSSILMALLLWIGLGESFVVNTIVLISIQVIFLIGLKLGEEVENAMVWQRILLLGGQVGLICLIDWGGQSVISELKYTSRMLLLVCLMITFMRRKKLKNQISQSIDLWIPPMWSVMLGFLIFLLAKVSQDLSIRRLWLIIGSVIVFISAISKENQKEESGMIYALYHKGYLKMMLGISMSIVLIVTYIPMPSTLPGSEWVQNQMKALRKQTYTSESMKVHLSRNPPLSRNIVLTVTADEPLYLRERAYTLYEHGTWRVKEEAKRSWTPFDGEGSYREYTLLRMLLQEIEAGEIGIEPFEKTYKEQFKLPLAEEQRHTAVVKEKKIPTNYLSVNGVTGIVLPENVEKNLRDVGVNEAEKLSFNVGYLGKLENLYFINLSTPMQKEYTIDYVTYELNEGTREKALLEKITPSEFVEVCIEAYEQSYEIGRKMIERGRSGYIEDAFYQLYTQIPEEIKEPLTHYATALTKGSESELKQAEAICSALKESGVYTYQLGAEYENLSRDPVIDFLFYGKQGICQDFASSMVLLCRSIGLPARYVEGYKASELGSVPNEYIVREDDAHAFVEVYISGYGWMTFDPTTSIQAEPGNKLQDKLRWGPFNLTKIQSIFLLAMIGIGFEAWRRISKTYLREWKKHQLWRKPPEVILCEFMRQTLQVLEQKGYRKEEDETFSQFGERLKEENRDIGAILKVYEAYIYGKQRPCLEQLKEVERCYETLIQSETKHRPENKKNYPGAPPSIEG